MTFHLSKEARGRGSIIGVCVCDALGGPVQFRSRKNLEPVKGYRYISQFDKPPGAWSDDGSLTLCLARSLSEQRGYKPADFIQKFCDWANSGYLSSTDSAWDEGLATQEACFIWTAAIEEASNLNKPLEVAKVQQKIDKDLNHERRSGNGSLMRVAPVGIMYHDSPQAAVNIARQQSELTHPYSVCGDACALYTILICESMKGSNKDALAQAVAGADVSNRILRERLAPYTDINQWVERDVQNIRSSGWVIDTLEAALWAFFTTSSFTEGALKAVNLGDDADTVGAVYGGLAGAFYGVEDIPAEWKEGLLKKELVTDIAGELTQMTPK